MPVVETSRRERKVIRFLRAMAKMEAPGFGTEAEVATVAVLHCSGASQMLSAVVWGLILCQEDSVLDWEFWVP